VKTPKWLADKFEKWDAEEFQHMLEDADWGRLAPEEKVRIVEAMGFVAFRDPHQPECPIVWDSGLLCNCVPPTTTWGPPPDVQVLRKETWEDRTRQARAWKERKKR
jgi:hypothetical protein